MLKIVTRNLWIIDDDKELCVRLIQTSKFVNPGVSLKETQVKRFQLMMVNTR